jgi:uncharacterized protein (DUF58 family)
MSRARAQAVPLDSPGVVLGADLLPRLERFAARVRAAGWRREGGTAGLLSGAGLEFAGYRPYRPGESARGVDWGLCARLDRPFVRLARREASERFALLLDVSASMGVGRPGKLQLAAEVAAALALSALGAGASVDVLASPGAGEDPARLLLRRPQELPRLLAFLGGLSAAGRGGLDALLAEPARLREAGRVVALGDLFDLEPARLLGLARRGRELAAAQILAPLELSPAAAVPGGGGVEWVDAETGARRALELDAAARAEYERELGRHLETWRAACARHRAAFGTWSSATPFEDVAGALLLGA